MDFKVFFIILLLSQIGLAFKNFRNLEILQSPRYYGIQSKTVYITCPVRCENCTQAEILWFKDGKELDSKIFTSTPQGINISHYIPNIHNGNYSCIFKSKQVTLRSAPISLISRYIPEYTLQNTSAKIGNTAIFHCYKSTYSAIIGKDYFYVTWFRGNSSLPLSLSHNLIIKGKFLFIKNVQPRDKGPYSCQLNVRPKNIVSLKRSGSFYLNVEDNHDKDVFPLFFTPSRDVALHMSFTVFCLLNHYNGNFTLRLFKLSDDGRIEVKVREQSDVGYLTYKITSFEIENAAIYVCEALQGGVRSREESVFNFVNAPELKNKHIFHYNQVLHANITLYCDVTTSFPTPTFKWYYNGYPLQISTGKNVISSSDGLRSKLFIVNLDVTDEGIYQCITENTVGNDVKYFDLRLGTSEFAPKNLVIKLVSPVQVTLTWSHGELSLSSSSRLYLVSWFHEDIDNNVGHLRTSETSALISGNGLFGGRRYRFLVCLFVEETMDYSDCVAQYITMPQDVPIKSPQMFEPKQEQQIGEKKIYFVRWKEIPDPLSMGIIRNYTIYCKEISTIQRQQQPQNELITFSQPYGVSSAHIYLPDNCTYKVWMTAVNDAGESPGSKSFYVQTALTEEILPSKPRNISHAFIYSKVDKLIYLKLEWQRPVYMGAETYSYIVRRQANPTSPKKLNPEYAIKVVFPLCEYSLFDGDHFDSWLVMKAVRTEGNNVHHQISISAVNDAGEGEAETFESSVANIPDSWEIRGRKKSGHDQSKKINDHDEGEQSNDLYLGVGIGLSVSAVFLTVLVVICLVKEPCKRIPRESRQFLLTDDFLFMQRMKERSRGGEGSSMGGEGSSRGGERETNDRQYGKNRTRLKEGAIILRMARPFLNIYNRYRHPDSREDSGSTEEALYSLSSGSVSNRSQITMIGTSSENYLQRTASAVL